ncbi:hypothetical protein NQD34_012474 [Periophthalmus magnuspinnatus]|uniref:uncharacterized protein LOC129456922 n=1 Tax=Periophthalmus magnuspinnatus TaxID=409849 RepID=UPI0022C1071D|nr:uncharacterized protein LOC129456922 [Periophthalmus magnuspinnatus]KAJ0000632.1 hypothetical protein NQD34_012474 [Periophthalmus magnuspinnatus]
MLVRLLLLLLLAASSECQSVGKEFVAVFLENIAYYHPSSSNNYFRIIALHNDTQVDLKADSMFSDSGKLASGEIREFYVNPELELDKSQTSLKVVTIMADKNISVEILSYRNSSVQTALLLPKDQLAQEYHLPPIPEIQRTTVPEADVTNAVTERSRFKVILVNADQNQDNIIAVNGTAGFSITLKPKEVAQEWVEDSIAGKVISGTAPFLALFGHPCAIYANCTCGLLFTPMLPTKPTDAIYIIPPAFSADIQVLMPSKGKRETLSSMRVNDPGPVVLQRPGLLLNLISEDDFGSCFAVHTVSDTQNWVVVMVPSDSTGHVHINTAIADTTWSAVSDTKYSWAKIHLDPGKHIVWHESALMAVWFIGEKVQSTMFGNPAARLSIFPDYRGCVLSPEHVEILTQQSSWQESIQACRNLSLDLISLTDPTLQSNIYQKIQNHKDNLTDLWMGLRKSSYSGEWYWISEEPLQHVDWAYGSPDEDDMRHCARISRTDPQRLSWTHHDCCSEARPVCYRHPTLLTI